MPNPCSSALFLAIDVGGQGCRCAVFDSKGNKHFDIQSHYRTYYPKQNWVEHRASDIITVIDGLLDAVQAHAQQQQITITASGLACQGATMLCWDKDSLEPLSAVISWQDLRAASALNDIQLTKDTIFEITGLHPSAHYGASKYQWCLKHLPAVGKALDDNRLTIGPLASYITQYFTRNRQAYCNHAHMARTLLWNKKNQQWSTPLLKAFSIPENILPKPCPNDFDYGVLEKLQIPLTHVNRDQSASLFSNGPIDNQCVYINMGTAIFAQRINVRLTKQFPYRLQESPCYTSDKQTLSSIEASIHSGMAVSAELETLFDKPISQADIEYALGDNSTRELPAWQLITASGLGSPYWRDDITSNINSGCSLPEAINSWLRSALYLLKQNLVLMDVASGRAEILVISGGLSRYDALCQQLADLTQRHVIRHQDSHATLRGTAYLAAGRPAEWQQLPAKRFIPSPSNKAPEVYLNWLSHLYTYIQRQPQKTVAVAHRGDVEVAQENTLKAITSSIENGITNIEFDVQIDAFGIPLLLHDPNLQRTHNINNSIFDTQSQSIKRIENLWQLVKALEKYSALHLFVEVKHDSINHWGMEHVLNTIAPLIDAGITYTLLARSQDFLCAARNAGHFSIGANVRQFSEGEHLKLLQLSPDFLVINHERIPADIPLWPGPWQWMVYEVESAQQAAQLQKLGASHMISFKAHKLFNKENNHARV